MTPAERIRKASVTIEVDRVRLYAFHGVSTQEQTVGNEFEVSVAVSYPPSVIAAVSDGLDDTISYAEIVDIIKKEMKIPSQLLEHVAGRIAGALLTRWPAIASGYVKVSKIAPPISAQLASASVTIDF